MRAPYLALSFLHNSREDGASKAALILMKHSHFGHYSNEHEDGNLILSAGVPCINLEIALFFSVVFIFSSSKESKKLRGLRIINFEEHIAKAAAKSIGSILLTGNYQHKFCCYAFPLFPQLRYTKPKGA